MVAPIPRSRVDDDRHTASAGFSADRWQERVNHVLVAPDGAQRFGNCDARCLPAARRLCRFQSGLHIGDSSSARTAVFGARPLYWGTALRSLGTKLSVRSPCGGLADGALREVASQKRLNGLASESTPSEIRHPTHSYDADSYGSPTGRWVTQSA